MTQGEFRNIAYRIFAKATELPQMPMSVTGYYMTFATTRAFMDKFQIDDRGVEDEHLEYPVNNWPVEQDRYNVLAGATIAHPVQVAGQSNKEDGILIMKRVLTVSLGDKSVFTPVRQIFCRVQDLL